MMLKNRLFTGLIFLAAAFAACEKPEVYNPEERFAIESDSIKLWADVNNIELTSHESGLFYHIDTLGEGAEIEQTDTLEVEYVCKLLKDTVVSQTAEGSIYKFPLEKGIPGWRAGLPLIRDKGQVRLLIPSPLAYQRAAIGGIPPNSPLDFTVRIRKVTKKK